MWASHVYENTVFLYATKEEAIENAWAGDEQNVFEVIDARELKPIDWQEGTDKSGKWRLSEGFDVTGEKLTIYVRNADTILFEYSKSKSMFTDEWYKLTRENGQIICNFLNGDGPNLKALKDEITALKEKLEQQINHTNALQYSYDFCQKERSRLKDCLLELKHNNHHTIEEEMWRIDEALKTKG